MDERLSRINYSRGRAFIEHCDPGRRGRDFPWMPQQIFDRLDAWGLLRNAQSWDRLRDSGAVRTRTNSLGGCPACGIGKDIRTPPLVDTRDVRSALIQSSRQRADITNVPDESGLRLRRPRAAGSRRADFPDVSDEFVAANRNRLFNRLVLTPPQ